MMTMISASFFFVGNDDCAGDEKEIKQPIWGYGGFYVWIHGNVG